MSTAATAFDTSGNIFLRSARLTGMVFGPLLVGAGPLLFALHLIEAGTGQFFTYATEYLRDTGREDILFIATIALLEMVVTMLWSAAWLIAIAGPVASLWRGEIQLAPSHRYARAFIQHFNQILIEQVRALAAVLWRVPLLLIPASNEYIRLSFVPLVVVFDSAYSEGGVDALQESRRLAKGNFWKLSFVVLLAVLAPWMVQSLAQSEGSELIWENPIGVSIGWLATFFVNLFATVYLCAFYYEIRARKSSTAALDSTIVESAPSSAQSR